MKVTDFMNLPVYINKGIYVGEVRDIQIDIEEKCIAKLILTDTNKNVIEDGMDVAVPYRWVSAGGDIIIVFLLRDFYPPLWAGQKIGRIWQIGGFGSSRPFRNPVRKR